MLRLIGIAMFFLLTTTAQAQVLNGVAEWDTPTTKANGEPMTPGFIAYYNVYLCDAPIIEDSTGQGGPVCVGKMQKIKVSDNTQIPFDYATTTETGTLYGRVSAVAINGNEGPPASEGSMPWDFSRPGPPTNFRFRLSAPQ